LQVYVFNDIVIRLYICTGEPLVGIIRSKDHNRTANSSYRSFQGEVGVSEDNSIASKI